MDSTRDCVQIGELRQKYGQEMNFKKWLTDPNNVYVGRHGCINMKENDTIFLFSYTGSLWKNPYKEYTKEYTREENISRFKDYIKEKIKTDKKYDISTLKGKNLGCWCKPNEGCHTDVLLELIKEYDMN